MYNIRCIVYDVPKIVLGTTNPEIQRLILVIFALLEAQSHWWHRYANSYHTVRNLVCVCRVSREGIWCGKQGKVSGFNFGNQFYEIQSKSQISVYPQFIQQISLEPEITLDTGDLDMKKDTGEASSSFWSEWEKHKKSNGRMCLYPVTEIMKEAGVGTP